MKWSVLYDIYITVIKKSHLWILTILDWNISSYVNLFRYAGIIGPKYGKMNAKFFGNIEEYIVIRSTDYFKNILSVLILKIMSYIKCKNMYQIIRILCIVILLFFMIIFAFIIRIIPLEKPFRKYQVSY